jgi:hypothetical protein
LGPISQRWFVEAKTVVEERHDIVAAFDHFPGSLSEARFVTVHEGEHPGAGEMKSQTPAEEREKIASCRLQESD